MVIYYQVLKSISIIISLIVKRHLFQKLRTQLFSIFLATWNLVERTILVWQRFKSIQFCTFSAFRKCLPAKPCQMIIRRRNVWCWVLQKFPFDLQQCILRSTCKIDLFCYNCSIDVGRHLQKQLQQLNKTLWAWMFCFGVDDPPGLTHSFCAWVT